MKKSISLLLIGAVSIGTLLMVQNNGETEDQTVQDHQKPIEKKEDKLVPTDHWMNIRSYPFGFDQEEYNHRMTQVRNQILTPATKAPDLGSTWVNEGPGNIGGRFNALAMSPTDNDIIYAGAANGGIFKTMDGGSNWTPIFDDHAYLAIGEIELDPNDENTLWVGTGDKNFGGGSHLGNGVYKSTDAGTTWTQMGLEETAIITEIAIDPTNSDRIFVSTLGNTYEKTAERGVYRTTDGGTTWQNVLFISDSSGVIDMVMDPSDPDIIYAAGFNRINLPFQAKITGPDAKIFKTTDGGNNWTQLGGGLPTTEESRIGLAISNTNPNVLYAIYTDANSVDVKDIYKTTNAGTTWTAMNVTTDLSGVQGGFGWYFGEVYLNPYDNNQLMVPGVDMMMSPDGGANWIQNVPDWWDYIVHADKHAILYLSATSYIIATDGGLYKTTNNGVTWTDIENIPVTQLYHVDVDALNPGMYGGGAQDNGTMQGNAALFNLWERVLGGDGFRLTYLVDDPGGMYCETQNGGLYYYNQITFDFYDISPSVNTPDRVNWDMPYHVNETDGEVFIGTSEVHVMSGAPFGSFVSISGDLTQVGQGTSIGADKYHTITEIDQSQFDSDKLYIGTSDGMVWRGDRSGSVWNWTNITGTLPDRYVTAVRVSPNYDETIYVGMSGYKFNEEVSYLYKSSDNGATWVDISGNLPGITVNDVLIAENQDDDYIFAALDGGVYFTADGGAQWDYVGTGMPLATISELALDETNEKLIAGTYSRSVWSYDVSWLDEVVVEPPSAIEENSKEITFYPNPVEDLVYFENVEMEYLDLYDAKGQRVLHKKVFNTGQYNQVNLSELPSGIFIFKGGEYTGRVVKK